MNSQDYKTKTVQKKILEISGMHNIRCSILWSYNIKNLKHVIQNPITFRSTIVILIATDKVLDLRESFFNGIEIG